MPILKNINFYLKIPPQTVLNAHVY